jgi:RNA polymerase sigma-54 factor
MPLKQKLGIKVSQKLALTPSLKQQLAIILLPKLELEQTVKTELEENPFLEEVINLEPTDNFENKADLTPQSL